MYKRIIDGIIKKKEEESIQQANQRHLETTKYNSNKLLIGYISTIITGKNEKLTQMISGAPRLFIRSQGNMLCDIETGQKYPLVLIGDLATQNVKCVLERNLEPFVSTCLDAIDEIGVKYGAFLSKNQAKDILNRQIKLNSLTI